MSPRSPSKVASGSPAAAAVVAAAAAAAAMPATPCCGTRGTASCYNAVSYTHLRAHETSAHL
eukprot:4552817-Alexandrium_andersonii.AAC.1